jgi:tRNA threonylcarbamoyladenosine biosynthesis protein TsaB
MKTLAFECSAVAASVCVYENGRVLGHTFSSVPLTHSQTLMPMAESLLSNLKISFSDIDRLAIANGPGSFTGVRIGIAAVKGLAAPRNLSCVGVSTLLSMAHQIPENAIICALMDARCGQVYNALYKYEGGKLITVTEPRALSVEELCAEINEKVIFVGDGVKVHKNKISELLGEKAVFAMPQHCLQRAASVAYAALEKTPVNPEDLSVVYLRKPQAEREREEKLSNI